MAERKWEWECSICKLPIENKPRATHVYCGHCRWTDPPGPVRASAHLHCWIAKYEKEGKSIRCANPSPEKDGSGSGFCHVPGGAPYFDDFLPKHPTIEKFFKAPSPAASRKRKSTSEDPPETIKTYWLNKKPTVVIERDGEFVRVLSENEAKLFNRQ